MDDLLREFLVETGENLDTVDAQLVQLEHEPNNQDILRAIFRLVHTIKGTCGFLGLPRLEALTHAAETVMGQFRDGAPVTRDAVTVILSSLDRIKIILRALDQHGAEPDGDDADLIARLTSMAHTSSSQPAACGMPAADLEALFSDDHGGHDVPDGDVLLHDTHSSDPFSNTAPAAAPATTLRVNVDTLERLMTMVSELVLTRNQLLEVSRQQLGSAYAAPLQRLSHVTGELQDCVMKTRMQPISHACQKLPRLVRDLCVELGKDIALVVEGADTELDRQVLDLIKDPLTHLVRNAADHGLELPQARIVAGKLPRGTIAVSARHSGGALVLTVADDGRGLNLPRIRAKALERGLAGEAELERMSDAKLARLIFHPGFSTAEEISAVSGRGVGMDVVAANVALAGGHVDVQSREGLGTTFTITLPLTLAILPALLVGVNQQRFALPQSAIAELVRIGPGSDAKITRMDSGAMMTLRGILYPLLSLHAVLGFCDPADAFASTEGFVALLSIDDRQFAVMIDQVLQTEEIVIKPISSKLRHLSLYSGCTILGDGSVVLILEPNALARMIGGEQNNLAILQDMSEPAKVQSTSVPLLTVRVGQSRQAVPLSAVTRLERIAVSQIEWSGAQAVVQYGGALMPLMRTDRAISRDDNNTMICLIIDYKDKVIGLVADEIIDVIDTDIRLMSDAGRAGILGSAIVQGAATDVIDVVWHLMQAFPDLAQRPQRNQAVPRVLLVEDCPFFRDMLAPVLRSAGFSVTVETDAVRARTLMPAHDAVIFDLDMFDGDRRAVLDQFCASCPHGMALMALSSSLDPETETMLRDLRVQALLSKFDRRGLIGLLQSHFSSVRQAA